MQIYNFGWLGLPIGIYFIIKKYHLHSGELWLLSYAILLMISTIIGGWIMQITHLIIVTAISIHILLISKQNSVSISQKKYNVFVRVLFHLQQELSIFVYMISAWLFIRIYTNKTSQFGIGKQYEQGKIFKGVNQSLSGWNCTQLQFVIIPLIWLIFNVLSYLIGNLIIKIQKQKDNLYKQYVIKYKVIPDTIFSLIVFSYNLYSYKNSNTLFQCCQYWQNGYLMWLSLYYGYAFSTLYFFHAKKGVFLIQGEQNTSDVAQNQDKKLIQPDNFK